MRKHLFHVPLRRTCNIFKYKRDILDYWSCKCKVSVLQPVSRNPLGGPLEGVLRDRISGVPLIICLCLFVMVNLWWNIFEYYGARIMKKVEVIFIILSERYFYLENKDFLCVPKILSTSSVVWEKNNYLVTVPIMFFNQNEQINYDHFSWKLYL